jgi:hypothetical protein
MPYGPIDSAKQILPMLLALLALIAFADLSHANPMGTQENFYDRPGGDYHHYQAGHSSQCATSCATIAKCRAYTYVRSTGVCWLKDRVPPRQPSNCCISGVKVMSTQEIGFDRPGSDLKPGFDVATSSQCEGYCKSDPNCRAYTFVKSGIQGSSAKCWLKHRKPAKVSNSCCISGTRLPARRTQ